MTNQAFFRSCEVVMFHKKLTTSPSMCGFRLVKKTKIERPPLKPTIKEDEEIPF